MPNRRNFVTAAAMAAFLNASLVLPCLASFTLDGSFGSGGKLTHSFPDSTTNYSSSGQRIFVQPNGRIVAAGSFTNRTSDGQLSGFAVVGFSAGGTVDTAYASGGRHLDWQSNGFTSLSDALMYADGRFLSLSRFLNVVGSSIGKATLHNVDGSVDTDFSTNAVFSSPGGFGTVVPRQIAVRGDGKVVVLIIDNSTFRIHRLNADGTHDTAFGVDGVVNVQFNKISQPSVSSMHLLPDGRIILAGQNGAPPSGDFFVARLTETGNWDRTFGRAGFRSFAFGPGLAGRIRNSVLQPDGALLLCGSLSGADDDTWMSRIRPTGRQDPSFGSGGVVVRDFAPDAPDTAVALTLSADGKIRMAGNAGVSPNFLVARFAANGNFEESTTFAFAPGNPAQAADIAIQPDGKLVVIGETRNPDAAITGSVFALARLTE